MSVSENQRIAQLLILLVLQSGICSAQETAGIGAALANKEGRIIINKLLPDGAALASGQLHVGDWIIAVQDADGEEHDVSASDVSSTVALLRGVKGTIIHLTVVPEGKKVADALTVTMKRGAIAALERFGDGKLPSPGDPIPKVVLTSLEDASKDITITDLRGRYVYLEIWATWCGPCQNKMNRLQDTARKYDTLKERLAFISAGVDETKEQAKKHVEKRNWRNTVNMWLNEAAIKELHLNSFPTAFLIDDKGTVIANDHEKNFEEEVSKLLKQLSGD